jgi:hypothetical protein
MEQHLAVWYKGPENMGPKIPVTFTRELTDKGLVFSVTNRVNVTPLKENSLGLVFIEEGRSVASLTWIALRVRFSLSEGDTLEIHPN